MTATTKVTAKLTNAEIKVLRFYKSIGKADKALGTGLRFCRSLTTIARETGLSEKTIQRANTRFLYLGILTWVRGNSASWRAGSKGQASKYRLMLAGTEGFAVPRQTVRELRRLLSATPNEPNRPSEPSLPSRPSLPNLPNILTV